MVRFQKKGRCIVCTKGSNNASVIAELRKRVEKRKIELDKRKWIYDEYLSLLKKQELDLEWIGTLERDEVILGGE